MSNIGFIMKIFKLNYVNKFVLALFCAFILNAKGICAEDNCLEQELLDKVTVVQKEHVDQIVRDEKVRFNKELVATIKSHSRRAVPEFINFASILSGSLASLKSLSVESSKSCGVVSACFGFVGAVLNTYNWYSDRRSIKGFAHNTLNGLSVLSNICAVPFSFLAAYSDPYEDNAYAVMANIIGGSAMLFKGLDLFLMTSPIDDYNCQLASRRES